MADAFSQRGGLLLENTAAGAEALRARVRRLQGWGYRCRLMEIHEVRALEPGLVAGSFTAASYSEVEGHVDVPRVIEACLRLAQERGAAVLTGRAVTGLRRGSSGRIEAVETSDGRLECDVVVVAGGTATPESVAHAGVLIPQPESPGIVIRTDARPPLLSSVSVIHLPVLAPGGRISICARPATA